MASITRFEEIQAWQLARKLTLRVYELTKRQPFDHDWSLKNQIRDAAGSTMHNIAKASMPALMLNSPAFSGTLGVQQPKFNLNSMSPSTNTTFLPKNSLSFTILPNNAKKPPMASSAT